ncbi:hypothetical protein H6503_01380 [Candidatus Woesearchaeota archaeon]|nr:hypothetical protein [Candidatus Woesearchaeota archaeon]
MKAYLRYTLLISILLIAVIIRMYFANSISFSDDESYYTLRQLESIKEHGIPLYEDELSYSGRNAVFSPGYYYILFFGSFIFQSKSLVILTSILAALSALIVYLISLKLTRNHLISVLVSAMGIFIPVYLINTTNTLSPTTLIIPLSLLTIYLFSIAKDEKDVLWYMIAFVILSLVTGLSTIIVIVFIMYLLMLRIENIRIIKVQKELTIVSAFFVIWVQFIIYKSAYLVHGPAIIWRNLPFELIIQYFSQVNIFSIIYFVGAVPFFAALYTMYKHSFTLKNEQLYLYTSFAVVIAALLLFRLIELQKGLIYLGFCFLIFFAVFLKRAIAYIERTKLNRYKHGVTLILIFVFLLSSIIPSIMALHNQSSIPRDTIDAMEWIERNTDENSVILADIKEGNLVTEIAKRKNIIDSNFLLIEDINQRVNDMRLIYTSSSIVKAVELLDYYSIDYILIGEARTTFNIEDLHYIDSECVESVYDNKIKIYKVKCRVELSE